MVTGEFVFSGILGFFFCLGNNGQAFLGNWGTKQSVLFVFGEKFASIFSRMN